MVPLIFFKLDSIYHVSMMAVSLSSHWREALECVSLVPCNLPFHADINLGGLPKWRCEWSVYRCRRHSSLTRGGFVWLAQSAALPCSGAVSHTVWLILQASSNQLRCLSLHPAARLQAGSVWDRSCYPSVEPELIQHALLLLGHADKAPSKEPVGCGYCCSCDWV